jgi:hypothetical protein
MPGPKSDKIWADAVRRAVMRRLENEEGKPQKIELGMAGDVSALKEIGDRLDGKPKQESDSNVNLAGSLELVKRIVR